ncbi:MAG: CPBP family intramembrane metalloprotease [Bdellovibrionales bacterium]|nr:CPBP family intramembrane metalloprotease [Bdellovibrionales bacterium]
MMNQDQNPKPKISVSSMAIFYFFLFAISMLIDREQRIFLFPHLEKSIKSDLIFDGGLIFGVSLLILLVSYLLHHYVRTYRSLSKQFSTFFSSCSMQDFFLIAAFSALGEEFFFRGVLQHYVGLVPASLMFGLLHTGPGKKYRIWTLYAFVVGLILGALYQWRQNLLLPLGIHFLVNFVTLFVMNKHMVTKTNTSTSHVKD